MPYSPTTWADGVTPVNGANLNKLEAGVQSGVALGEAAIPAPAGPTDKDFLVYQTGTGWVRRKIALGDIPAGVELQANKTIAGGYPSLDGTGKVPLAQLPSGLGGGGTAVIGSVSSAGAILSGTGFTVARLGAGQYQITFSAPFPSAPVVESTLILTPGSGLNTSIDNVLPGSCRVWVYTAAGVPTDNPFNFIASQGVSYTPTPMSDKTVGGSVGSTGTIVSGTGFTIAKGAAGVYNVTFTTPFPSPPVITANLLGNAAAGLAIPSNVTVNGFTLTTYTPAFAGADNAWDFVATLGFTYAPTTLLGKMVNGSVPAAGTTPTSGTGFTYTHTNGSGIYVFTFSTPFPTPPIITANLLLPQANKVWVYVTAVSTTGFTLGLYDNGAGAIDAPINFEARDPNLAVASSTLPATTIGSEWSYNQIVAPATATGTTEAGAGTIIPGSSATYDGLKVRIEFWAPSVTQANGPTTGVITRDGVAIGQAILMPQVASETSFAYMVMYDTPSAGSHIYALKAFSGAGTNTIGAGPGGAGAQLPAFLRVTKA